MTELRKSSIVLEDACEYYHGDLPGTLQYAKKPEELLAIPNLALQDGDCGYLQIPVTQDHLKRFIPNTETGRSAEWELLVVFQRTKGAEIWMKGALRNTATGNIALMTTTNNKENILSRGNRALKSHDPEWFIGFYRMCAPMVFWRAVVAAIAAPTVPMLS